MSEQINIDSERPAFEAAFEGMFFSSCFEREDDGSYAGRGLQGAWLGWQKARSLPVGVPDGLRDAINRADEVLAALTACTNPLERLKRNHGADWSKAVYDIRRELLALLAAAPAVPTVKAERVPTPEFVWVHLLEALAGDNGCSFSASTDDYREAKPALVELIAAGFFRDAADSLDGDIWMVAAGEQGEAAARFASCADAYAVLSVVLNRVFDRPEDAPSLPAAGSAVEEAPEQWCDKDHLVSILADVIGRERMSRDRLPDRLFAEVIYKAISEHLPIYEDVYDQCSSIIEPYVARPHRPDGMLPGSVVDSLRLLLQHRLTALSAQQPAPDAPERVSVPVKLLRGISFWLERTNEKSDEDIAELIELRALLASHGRGEA